MADSEAASSPQNYTRRLPDDTFSFFIYPDSPLSTPDLQTLHFQILHTLSPYTQDYIWKTSPSPYPSPPAHLSLISTAISATATTSTLNGSSSSSSSSSSELSPTCPSAFLTPTASFCSLRPPSTSLDIIPYLVNPLTLLDSLRYLISNFNLAKADKSVQLAIMNRIKDNPDRTKKNMHRARVRVPVLVAQVLKHELCLISLAVEGFYDRDIDSMKYASTMERFLPGKSCEEVVEVSMVMSRAMYGQLEQQTFRAPKGYPMPGRGEVGYVEAELGMKIACGFEMVYQMRKRDGLDGRGSTWEAFREFGKEWVL